MTRLLLPFTHGIDASAISATLALAQHCGATVVFLSLIHLPEGPARDPRWEDIQQSKDFLAFVQHKAARWGVSIEQMEFHTGNPVCTIHALAQEMECAGIVLVVRGGVGLLLATHEVKELLEEKSIPLYIIQLHEKNSTFSLPQWLSRWFRSTALREPSMTSLHTPANDIQKIFFMKDES